MKIRNFIFLGMVLCSLNLNAQQARLVGGLNLANVSVTDDGRVDDAKMLTSFHAGIIGDFRLGGLFFIQPGLLFTGKGTESESGDESSATYFRATTNPYYIELPVNIVFKTPHSVGPGFL